MSQDHNSDPPRSDRDHEHLEKFEERSFSEDDPHGSSTALPRKPDPAATTSDSEDISRIDRLGRNFSTSTRSSEDSQRTVSEGHDAQVTAHRSRSRGNHSRAHSSTRSVRREAIVVPRSERRGLLARFCVFPEITNAQDFSRKQKWTITAIVALAGAAAPMGSSIVLPALVDITREFNSTPTIANLSVAMYMLSMSIFPLWWSSFSETLGRRTIYVVSFFLFLIFNILAAVSSSMAMFIVMRMLSGGAAASVQAVGGGTIADVWEVKERGAAMGMFYLGPLCGPLVSPILGGVFAQTLGWRSAQWFLAIFAGLLWLFVVGALPETLRRRKPLAFEAEQEAIPETDEKGMPRPGLSRMATTQSVKVKSKKYLVMARRIFLDPLRVILYMQFPAVAILVAYAAWTFGALYVLNISVQATFTKAPYNYNSIIIGCLYLPNSAGYFLSSTFGGRWVDRIMHREARKAGRYDERGRLIFIPEDRMKENAYLGSILYPASLLAYGWFAEKQVNVAAPMVFNFFFGVGSMLIFALVTTMLTEFMPRKASSGIALNNFVRNILSCIGAIVTEPIINGIGDGWLFTGIAIIAWVTGILTVWSMKKFGPRWRIAMDKRLDKVMGD
ncbi:MFS antiporter QDR3 [Cercospora beticola]|uniref:MFS antiporter QDR3 n=1 Tax=Cercospora beticola TaxID=122368 RepID=A0A2G5IDA0_CERBT|nr:MFS antiporter QDR3 [Cercospora beticola]PIB02836.1 MFS antiporter QDR3 [Cercospora beticola]WPB04090.1 hypothetical protein RHO25_008734 [Cercospora beticola]CAK1357119.1 unnamed protein product [Cercospora beticola]